MRGLDTENQGVCAFLNFTVFNLRAMKDWLDDTARHSEIRDVGAKW